MDDYKYLSDDELKVRIDLPEENVKPQDYEDLREYVERHKKGEENILEIDNLHSYFFTEQGVVKAVNGVSFDIPKNKTVGIVGESGCGKSVTSLSIMGLLGRGGTVEDGSVLFEGKNLLKMTEKERINVLLGIRPKLKIMNQKLIRLTRAIKYTSMGDVWNEITDRQPTKADIHNISRSAFQRWKSIGRNVRP